MTLPALGQTPPSTRTPDEVLAELDEVAEQLAALQPIMDALWERRQELWVEAIEGFDPPTTQQRIAMASRTTQAAVSAGMRKINERRAKAAAERVA